MFLKNPKIYEKRPGMVHKNKKNNVELSKTKFSKIKRIKIGASMFFVDQRPLGTSVNYDST